MCWSRQSFIVTWTLVTSLSRLTSRCVSVTSASRWRSLRHAWRNPMRNIRLWLTYDSSSVFSHWPLVVSCHRFDQWSVGVFWTSADLVVTHGAMCLCFDRLIDLLNFIRVSICSSSIVVSSGSCFLVAPHGHVPPFSHCPFISSSFAFFSFPFSFSHSLYLFSSFVHPFPFYQSSPTPFPGQTSQESTKPGFSLLCLFFVICIP